MAFILGLIGLIFVQKFLVQFLGGEYISLETILKTLLGSKIANAIFGKIHNKMLKIGLKIPIPQFRHIVGRIGTGVLLLGLEGTSKLAQLFRWLVDIVRVGLVAQGFLHFFQVLHEGSLRQYLLFGWALWGYLFQGLRYGLPVL